MIMRARDEANRRIVYVRCDHEGCGAAGPVVLRNDHAKGPYAAGAAIDAARTVGWLTNLMGCFSGPSLHFCPMCAPKHTIMPGEVLTTLRAKGDDR